MDPFSYLSVLISIILAMGMTRVLAGVGEMLQARSRRRIYWVHAVWIVNLFIYLVIGWWIFYRWRNQQPWTFFLFVFVLISPTILFLASLILFPREGARDESVNYKTHFYANHRAFFILMAVFLLQTGTTIAAITRNERYHQVYAIVFLLQTVIASFAIFHTLV